MESRPIAAVYAKDSALVALLKKYERPALIRASERFFVVNSYFRIPLEGALPHIYLREAVLLRLIEASKSLPAELSFAIFDGFRTKQAQRALFSHMKLEVKRQNPQLTEAQTVTETRNYCFDPDDPSRPHAPPHNTGGAIDLGLCHKKDGTLIDMGTAFDDPNPVSFTNYFESDYPSDSGKTEQQWVNARQNRRMLFYLMIDAGFTNYEHEWWHFDLGNSTWAKRVGESWYYDSLEPLIHDVKN